MGADVQPVPQTYPNRRAIPSKEELAAIIEAAGSSDAEYFGYPVLLDGLYLQQDPEEFTAALEPCKRVYDDLIRFSECRLYRNFDNRFGISLWKRVAAKRKSGSFNRKVGWGKI